MAKKTKGMGLTSFATGFAQGATRGLQAGMLRAMKTQEKEETAVEKASKNILALKAGMQDPKAKSEMTILANQVLNQIITVQEANDLIAAKNLLGPESYTQIEKEPSVPTVREPSLYIKTSQDEDAVPEFKTIATRGGQFVDVKTGAVIPAEEMRTYYPYKPQSKQYRYTTVDDDKIKKQQLVTIETVSDGRGGLKYFAKNKLKMDDVEIQAGQDITNIWWKLSANLTPSGQLLDPYNIMGRTPGVDDSGDDDDDVEAWPGSE